MVYFGKSTADCAKAARNRKIFPISPGHSVPELGKFTANLHKSIAELHKSTADLRKFITNGRPSVMNIHIFNGSLKALALESNVSRGFRIPMGANRGTERRNYHGTSR
jgi:hypothetical protein